MPGVPPPRIPGSSARRARVIWPVHYPGPSPKTAGMHHRFRRGVPAVLLASLLVACTQSPGAPALATPPASAAWTSLDVLLTKSPTCSCCTGHEAYLEGLGMRVRVTVDEDINAVKDLYAIPAEMRSCHTSTIGRYFVEGHVPFAAIQQLMERLPDIDGISLPGMPAGSPGMGGELEGPLVVYAIDGGQVVGEFGSF